MALAVNTDSAGEVDTAFDTWLAAAGTSVRAPAVKEWSGHPGYLSDPDGHLWDTAYNPSRALIRIDERERLELVRTTDRTGGRGDGERLRDGSGTHGTGTLRRGRSVPVRVSEGPGRVRR